MGKYILTLILTLGSLANAGAISGGGGKSIVCRDSNGAITSAEILDLFEGRVQYNLAPAISKDPIDKQVSDVIGRLGKGRGNVNTIMSYANYISATKTILPDGTSLVAIDDAQNVVVPKNCAVEQLANYTDQNQILVNGEIWSHLDNTNKAALIVHEALYKVFRMYGATNSIRARKSVAIGFAGGETSLITAGVPQQHFECQTLPDENGNPFPGSHFYAYNDVTGMLIFQFDQLDGHLMLTKSTIQLDPIPVNQMGQAKDSIYWVNLNSSFDMFLGVSVAFQTKVENGVTKKVMKIGIGNMPYSPTAQFKCHLN